METITSERAAIRLGLTKSARVIADIKETGESSSGLESMEAFIEQVRGTCFCHLSNLFNVIAIWSRLLASVTSSTFSSMQ